MKKEFELSIIQELDEKYKNAQQINIDDIEQYIENKLKELDTLSKHEIYSDILKKLADYEWFKKAKKDFKNSNTRLYRGVL